MSKQPLALIAALWFLAPIEARPAPLSVIQVVRDSASGLAGASAIAISPDGQNAYVTSYGGNSVAVFYRDLSINGFRYLGKLVNGVGGVDGIGGASAVAVSPDGYSVYVTGETSNALAVFDRSTSIQGMLTFVSALHDGDFGVDGLSAPTGVAVAPSGRIFVSSAGDNALSAYESSFPSLVQVGLWKNGDPNPYVGGSIGGLLGATGVATADGYFGTDVYVSSETDSSVSVFTISFLSQLYQTQVVQDGVDGFDGLAQAQGLALSPSGLELYVAGTGDSAVAILDRDPNTALLSVHSLAQNGVDGVSGLGAVDSICADPGGDSVYAGGGEATGLLQFTPDVVALAVDGFDHGLDFVGVNVLPGYTGRGGSHVAVASLPDSTGVVAAESLSGRFSFTGQLSTFSRDFTTGALTERQTLPDDVGVVGMRGAQSVVASPDGKHVYVLGSNGTLTAEFSTSGASGTLAYIGTVGLPGEDPHTVVPRYRMAALSPDGHSLYEARWRDDVIVHWLRDAGTGVLTPSGGGIGSNDVDALIRPSDLVISPDGMNVYAVGGLGPENWLMAFSRDPATGALQHLQTLAQSDVLALRYADSIAITSDGVHVYVGPRSYDGISVFTRQPDGTLAFLRGYPNNPGVDPNSGLQYPVDIEMSPDGSRLCIVNGSVACAYRNPSTGQLSSVQTATTAAHQPDPATLAFSPDGTRLHVTSYDYLPPGGTLHSGLLTYAIDPSSGAISLIEDDSDLTGIDSVEGAIGLAVSPNGARIYVAAYRDDALTVFEPEPGAVLSAVAALGALGVTALKLRRRPSTTSSAASCPAGPLLSGTW